MQHLNRWRSARTLTALLLALAGAVTAVAGQAPGEPLDWIQRMNKAVVEGSFAGIFEQRIGTRRETWRIVHRFQDGQMVERLVSTDGTGYEQKRKGSQWAHFLPKDRRVVTATRNRSFGYLEAINGLDELSARHYAISDAGRARLLGREVQMIHVEPKDGLRFGYRFWLDAHSALPLKLQRIAQDGEVVKELTFTFINAPLLPTDITDEQLKVAVDFRGFTRFDQDLVAPFYNAGLKRALAPQAALMPPGYRARRFGGLGQDAKAAGPRARFIVSDGVSWAEVFLAPIAGEPAVDQGGMMGSRAVYRLTVEGVAVNVMGEVPLSAAQAIAKAFRPE